MNITGSNLFGGTVLYGASAGEKIVGKLKGKNLVQGIILPTQEEESGVSKAIKGLLVGAGALTLGVVAHKTGILSKITSTIKNAEGKNIFQKIKSSLTGENIKKGATILKDGTKTFFKNAKANAKAVEAKYKSSDLGEKLKTLKDKGKDFGKVLKEAGKSGLETTKEAAKITIQNAKDYMG